MHVWSLPYSDRAINMAIDDLLGIYGISLTSEALQRLQ